jgi:hypothetical protein
VLAAQGVPYRIDEMNSCYNGGAKDSSDTYASTLWALDCTHWWAAHHILGVNYHTGESVGRDGGFGPRITPRFLASAGWPWIYHATSSLCLSGFQPGRAWTTARSERTNGSAFNFNAYAYRDHDGSIYLTLINKSYGDQRKRRRFPFNCPKTRPGHMATNGPGAEDQDVAAKTGVMLGGASVDAQGIWPGQWEKLEGGNSGHLTVQVAPASATILHFSPGS